MPLIFGRTSSGLMVPVLVDGDGVLATQSLGYIGGAWQKDPLRIGYSGQVLQSTINTALAAGTNILNTGVVPANRVWIITQLTIQYAGTVAGVSLYVDHFNAGGTPYALFNVLTVVSGQAYDKQGHWVLASGDYIRLAVTGATLNDDATVVATGYYFDTAQ